jgi:hypothetical protein
MRDASIWASMTLFLAAEAGLGIQMSQTSQQEQGATVAKPGPRKDWELFWRIIAGLMLIVIAWVLWVLYQITPRSVVTPLAYEPRTKSIGTPQTPAGSTAADASLPPVSITPAIQAEAPGQAELPRATGASEADLALDQAQAAARAGAHQSSADVQAAAIEKAKEMALESEPVKMEGLKLSTEISTPLAGKKKSAERAGSSPGVALPDSAGRARH